MPGLELGVDLDAVAELSDERSALWERVGAADFLSAAEKRALLGLESMAAAVRGEEA